MEESSITAPAETQRSASAAKTDLPCGACEYGSQDKRSHRNRDGIAGHAHDVSFALASEFSRIKALQPQASMSANFTSNPVTEHGND
jgi:hypothetical protein